MKADLISSTVLPDSRFASPSGHMAQLEPYPMLPERGAFWRLESQDERFVLTNPFFKMFISLFYQFSRPPLTSPRNSQAGATLRSRLHLVDLAGSERLSPGPHRAGAERGVRDIWKTRKVPKSRHFEICGRTQNVPASQVGNSRFIFKSQGHSNALGPDTRKCRLAVFLDI